MLTRVHVHSNGSTIKESDLKSERNKKDAANKKKKKNGIRMETLLRQAVQLQNVCGVAIKDCCIQTQAGVSAKESSLCEATVLTAAPPCHL